MSSGARVGFVSAGDLVQNPPAVHTAPTWTSAFQSISGRSTEPLSHRGDQPNPFQRLFASRGANAPLPTTLPTHEPTFPASGSWVYGDRIGEARIDSKCAVAHCTVEVVARSASELPADPLVVVTNPDEDCSPEAFRALIDQLLASPEPELDSIGAAEALSELRVDSGA